MTNAAVLSRFLRRASFWWGVKAYGTRTAELAARKDLAETIACLPEGLPNRYVVVRDAAVAAMAQPCDPARHVALSDALNAYWIAASRRSPDPLPAPAAPADLPHWVM
jgi:hypothetical protein